SEIDNRAACRGRDDAGGLRREDGLQTDLVQDEGLEDLGLPDRRDDLEDRLIRENWGPFRDGENVAGEAEAAKVVEQALGKQSERPQIGDVVRTEAEVFDFSQ